MSPSPDDVDELYLGLKGARERLARAQVLIKLPSHRRRLQIALDEIDVVGNYQCPQWSRFDLPEI